jgi:hypothetical protein
MTFEHDNRYLLLTFRRKKNIISWFKEKSNALSDTATEHSKCVFISCVREDDHRHDYSPLSLYRHIYLMAEAD